MPIKRRYNRAEAAQYLDKTISALNTMATRQKDLLPFSKEGRHTYYKKNDLDNYNNAKNCDPA